jgi:hypothetical protein
MIETLVDNETFVELLYPAIDKAWDGFRFVEVGCFIGGMTTRVAKRFKDRGTNPDIIVVDNFLFENISIEGKSGLPNEDYYKIFIHNINQEGVAECVTPIREDSIKASQLFRDRSIDFLFLDGEHFQGYIMKEIEAWLPKVKMGGIIAGHDYCSSSDIRDAVAHHFGDSFNLTSNQASFWRVL